ncbi:MAG: hypothetical protein K2K23_04515, partial [Muribaculaceae bacterium]|nr:hypothetical protein [Muribaculaceae bacterium]
MKNSFRLLMSILAFCFFPIALSAQKDDMQKAEVIKGMSDIIYGEGEGDTPADADRLALQSLLSKIGTTVKTSIVISEHETSVDGKLDLNSDIKTLMNSYSQATVNNTQTLRWRDKNRRYYQLTYMHRSELEKMFAHRRDRVEDYVRMGLRAEEKGRIDDALRYLNWAFVLLHSLQYPSSVKMMLDGEDVLLVNWIPDKMTDILKDVDVSVAKKGDDNTVDVLFKYKDKPAAVIDFTYWNGKSNSPINSAKGG